jgi:carbon monoxide dehydrogenase subunit G
MPSASNEILIDRARDDVFAFLADPENDRQWRDGVLDLKRVSGEGVGARYAQGVKGPGGRRIAADIEITELTPGETIAFQTIGGPVRPHGRYLLIAADGRTRVRFELEAEIRGLKRLMAPIVQKTMNDEVGQLAKLKDVIEAR